MKQQEVLSATADLEEVRKRFEQWRRTRKRGARIPEDLWAEAVRLSNAYSLTQICQSLRVEFNHLKRRIELYKDHPIHCPSVASSFVEMNISEIMPSSGGATIEMERSDGARMRMSVRGAVDDHLIEMAKAFWSRP
jgi:hypothetical protein